MLLTNLVFLIMKKKIPESFNNNIGDYLSKITPTGFQLMAKREFFLSIDIRQKRWGQIVRNEVPATLEEFMRISKHFQIPLSKLIDRKKYLKIKSVVKN